MSQPYQTAKITATMLGIEDHGILTCSLCLDLEDGGGVWYGGFSLDEPPKVKDGKHERIGSAAGMDAIRKLLRALEVDQWEKLPGTPVRLRPPLHIGMSAGECEIGHLLKNQWFGFRQHFKAQEGK